MRAKKLKGCCIKVPWQKKPLLYTNPSDLDMFNYFIKTWETANQFLIMAKGENLILSDHISFLMNEIRRLGMGDVSYKEWYPWTKEKEKKRKCEMERLAEIKDEPESPEKLTEFDRFAMKTLEPYNPKNPKKLDIGFRVFRLVDENGNSEGDISKIIENEKAMGNKLLPGERPRITVKKRFELFEFTLRLKYDKEFRFEIEEQNNIKIVNIT